MTLVITIESDCLNCDVSHDTTYSRDVYRMEILQLTLQVVKTSVQMTIRVQQ